MNYRGVLQEYCIGKGIASPVYTNIKTGGPDHQPKWKCSAVVIVGNNKYELISSVYFRKKDTIKDVSKSMHTHLENIFNVSTKKTNDVDISK